MVQTPPVHWARGGGTGSNAITPGLGLTLMLGLALTLWLGLTGKKQCGKALTPHGSHYPNCAQQ